MCIQLTVAEQNERIHFTQTCLFFVCPIFFVINKFKKKIETLWLYQYQR